MKKPEEITILCKSEITGQFFTQKVCGYVYHYVLNNTTTLSIGIDHRKSDLWMATELSTGLSCASGRSLKETRLAVDNSLGRIINMMMSEEFENRWNEVIVGVRACS